MFTPRLDHLHHSSSQTTSPPPNTRTVFVVNRDVTSKIGCAVPGTMDLNMHRGRRQQNRAGHSLRCRVECGVAVDVAVNARCTNQEARRRTRRACRAMAYEWKSTGAGRGIACAAPLADTSPTRTLRPGRRPRPAPLGNPSSACSAASSRPPSARARAPRGWQFRAPGSRAGRLFLWGRRRRRPRARPQEPGRHI